MKKKFGYIIIGIVLLVTILLIALHLSQDTVNTDNAVTLFYGEIQVTVPLEQLSKGEFSGTLTNGKGEKTESTFSGIELRELLEQEGYDLSKVQYVEAVAQDQYSAKLYREEILEPGKVYIAVKKNEEALPGLQSGTHGAQLIVFGDPDCKRCVSFLEKITLYDDH